MAMTIEQRPAYNLQPAGTDWIFTISSTNVSGNYKYKFIADLQIAQGAPSSNTIRLKFSPNDAGVGIINISEILQDYVNFDLLGYNGTTIKAEYKTNDASDTNRFGIPMIDKLSLSGNSIYNDISLIISPVFEIFTVTLLSKFGVDLKYCGIYSNEKFVLFLYTFLK